MYLMQVRVSVHIKRMYIHVCVCINFQIQATQYDVKQKQFDSVHMYTSIYYKNTALYACMRWRHCRKKSWWFRVPSMKLRLLLLRNDNSIYCYIRNTPFASLQFIDKGQSIEYCKTIPLPYVCFIETKILSL